MSESRALWSEHVWFLVYHGACNAPQGECPPASELTGRDLCIKEKYAAVLLSFVYLLLVVVLFRVAKLGSGSSVYQEIDKV